jgi:hypothetical protein
MTDPNPKDHNDTGPLCFVLMPFGTKHDPAGGPDIDFNRIYFEAIEPGVRDAGMVPIRADEEQLGGIIHKAMFDRLLRCEYAVADLTTSNPNVMYELGVRHAARPRTTLTIYAASTPLPFDVNHLRTQPYHLSDNNMLSDVDARTLRHDIAVHLRQLRERADHDKFVDSPLFQLISQWSPEPLAVDPSEFSPESVKEIEAIKRQVRVIRSSCGDTERRDAMLSELATIRDTALSHQTLDVALLSEIMQAYRALESWSDMITLYDRMPEILKRQVKERQLLAFAYNRRADADDGQPDDRAKALTILEELQDEQGFDPETSGLIGRIYKSRWRKALKAKDTARAERFLDKAIDAYVHGFEADWRDYYPGINAITLLEAKGDKDALALRNRLLPVVRFAAERKLRGDNHSYWDDATILELAVHAGDTGAAEDAMDDVLSSSEENWQLDSTADNLQIVADMRTSRGENVSWITALVDRLRHSAR